MDLLRRNLRRPWVVMPAVAVIALGGWVVAKPDDTPAPTLPTSRTVEATKGPMARTVTAQGTVAAAQSEDLSFGTAGTVTAVNVKAGDRVTVGQVLATIDASELEADVAAAEASVAEAQAQLSDHKAAGASSAQITADTSSVASAKDHLAEAQEALGGARLTAGFDGTVTSVDLTVGEELSSSGDGSSSPSGSDSGSGRNPDPLGASSDQGGSTGDIQVISAGRYTVDLGVDDADVASLATGQSAKVTLSTATSSQRGGRNLPGGFSLPAGLAPPVITDDAGSTADAKTPTAAADASTATGEVTAVSTIADASSGVSSYPVTVDFTDDSGDFNVGATVLVDITIAEVQDVVQVPSFAVTTDGDSSTVTVTKDGKEETREVTTGLTSGGMVEITSGLEAGEEVVIKLGGRFGGNGGTGGTGTQGGEAPVFQVGPEGIVTEGR